jgi:predicted transcriptional regulator
MGYNSFFKKVLSYLSELNKGKQNKLMEDGWLSEDEASRIIVILDKLGYIEKREDGIKLSRKGLNFLLYFKMEKISDEYSEQTLELLLSAD